MRHIIIFCLFLAIIFILRFVTYYSTKTEYKEGQRVVIQQTLLDEPKVYKNQQVFYADGLRVIIARFPEFKYGDKVIVSGIVAKQIISQRSNVINKKEILFVKYPKIELVKNNSNILLSVTSFIRQKVTITFNQFLNKNEAGLLLGIVFGIRQNMDSDFYNALRNAGVLHVIAASGMNVSMIAGFLLGVFLLFCNRFAAILLTFIGIIFYAVLSGLDPSIVRASIMAGLSYSAAILGRQNFAYISLFITCFIMLFISPELISDVGFQLSFLSTFGILSIKPLLTASIKFRKISKIGIIDDFSTTFSAQAGSMPVLLINFGSYQVLSILVNMLVLWTIPILMILGGIASLLAIFLPSFSPVFLYLSYPFLLFFESVVLVFSSVVKPSEIGSIPVVMVVGYYFILISIILFFSKKRSKETHVTITS